MLCIFLNDYNMRLKGIKSKKYLGYLFLNAFLKWRSLLHQCRTRRNSKPISWNLLPFGVPVKVKHALYWTDAIFSWKELLKAWPYRPYSKSRWCLTKALLKQLVFSLVINFKACIKRTTVLLTLFNTMLFKC